MKRISRRAYTHCRVSDQPFSSLAKLYFMFRLFVQPILGPSPCIFSSPFSLTHIQHATNHTTLSPHFDTPPQPRGIYVSVALVCLSLRPAPESSRTSRNTYRTKHTSTDTEDDSYDGQQESGVSGGVSGAWDHPGTGIPVNIQKKQQ